MREKERSRHRLRGGLWELLRWAKQTGRLGRPSELIGAQLRRVETVLLEGPQVQGYSTDLWTLPWIARVIEDVTGVRSGF